MKEMHSSQFCRQCLQNLTVRGCLGKGDHGEEIPPAESSAKLLGQLSPQCGDNLHSILRALLLENVLMNPATDVPVKRHQTGINRPGNGFAGREDEIAHIRKQRRGRGGGFGSERARLGLGGHGSLRVARSGGFGKGESSPPCGESPNAILHGKRRPPNGPALVLAQLRPLKVIGEEQHLLLRRRLCGLAKLAAHLILFGSGNGRQLRRIRSEGGGGEKAGQGEEAEVCQLIIRLSDAASVVSTSQTLESDRDNLFRCSQASLLVRQ